MEKKCVKFEDIVKKENPYEKDEIMEIFKEQMNGLMNSFYEKNQMQRQKEFEAKMIEKETKIEEEFKRKRDRLLEMRDMQLEAQTKVRIFEHRENQALEEACEVLGLPKCDKNRKKLGEDKMRTLIELRRIFSDRYIQGL